jgi:hypothetical protein
MLILLPLYTITAQTLTVSNGSLITINDNSSVSFDGLVLAPNLTYVISAPNAFERSSTPILVGENSSINRVYNIENELSDYLGVITFSYKDSELNGISEPDLVLEVNNHNDLWTNVAPTIDETKNTLTYNFTEILSFTNVTASSVNATLSIKTLFTDNNLKVYPNPTADYIYIQSDFNYTSKVYNTVGQLVLNSNSKQINVIDLPSGVYLLQLESNNNSKSTFKIIKK